jgi:hypothetical protein
VPLLIPPAARSGPYPPATAPSRLQGRAVGDAMAAEAEAQAAAVLEQLHRVGAKVFFEKQLTSSDVSASGRVVVPKVRGRLVAWA